MSMIPIFHGQVTPEGVLVPAPEEAEKRKRYQKTKRARPTLQWSASWTLQPLPWWVRLALTGQTAAKEQK